jgi:acyl-coenzyme A thioesterase PaaI-like protein
MPLFRRDLGRFFEPARSSTCSARSSTEQSKAALFILLRVEERHGNARGAAHGGFLLTLADIALGDQA